MKFTESPVNGRPGRGVSSSSPEPPSPQKVLGVLEPSELTHLEPARGPAKRVNLDFEEKRALIASSLSQEKRVLIANSLSEYLGTLPGTAEYTPSTIVQTSSLDSSVKFLNNGIPELSGRIHQFIQGHFFKENPPPTSKISPTINLSVCSEQN